MALGLLGPPQVLPGLLPLPQEEVEPPQVAEVPRQVGGPEGPEAPHGLLQGGDPAEEASFPLKAQEGQVGEGARR